jgi:hypothetical protein
LALRALSQRSATRRTSPGHQRWLKIKKPKAPRCNSRTRWEVLMNRKFIVAILLVVAVPVYAHAQNPRVSKRDAQKVVRIISGDKAKTQTYCDMVKLGEQIEQANDKKDSKSVEELSKKLGELGPKLGPEICRIDGRASGH